MANNIPSDRSTLLSTSEPIAAVILQLADGTIAACNPATAEILGYTAEELIGKTPFDLTWQTIYADGSAFLPADYPAIIACQTGQPCIQVSMGFYRPDRELIWLKLDAQPLFRASESAPYAVVTTISKLAEPNSLPPSAPDCQLTEAALRESEARFRQIAETIEDVFWISNPWERQIYYLSPAYERIWGRSRERAYTDYQSWYESIHPEDRPRLQAAFFQQIQAGNFDAEYRIVRPDGSMRWIHDRGFAVKDEFGNCKQVVGIAEDITERQQAAAILGETEQRLQNIVANVPSIVWTAAPDGTINWASDGWYAYTGITPEQNARDWPQVLHPDDLDRCLTQWHRALEEGREYKIEVRNRRHDGEYRWFLTQATPRRDRTGRIIAWFGSTTDIDDRKQAEESLRQSEEFKNRMLDSSPDCIKVLDLDGQLTYMNAGGMCLMEIDDFACYHNAEWLGFWQGKDRYRAEAALASAKAGEMAVFQGYCPTAKGTPKWWEVIVSPIFDGTGRVEKVLSLSRDITARQQTEIALRENEERLRLALTAANQGLYDLNIQTGEAIVSPQYALMLGYDPLEFEENNAKWQERTHPDDRERVSRAYEDYIAGRSNRYEVEFRQRTKLGNWKWILSIGSIVEWDDDVEPLRLLGTHTDISDRKQTEMALQESETRLQLALIAGRMGIFDWNVPTGAVVWSEDHYTLLGFRPGTIEPTYQIWAECVHPDDLQTVEAAIQQAMAQQTEYCQQYRVIWPDGSVHWVEGRGQVFYDTRGRCVRMLGVLIDVSDRQQAELALRDSEERCRYLVESIPQLVWTADRSGVLLDVNQRWIDYTGVTLAQIHLDGWASIVHPDDALAMNDRWLAAQTAGSHYQAEGRMRRADGIYRWHLHQAMPLKDDRDRIVKWFGTATDIHDRIELERQRDRLLAQEREARTEAERANRLKDEFLAVVSHELRTPLNPILGWVQILQRGKFNESRLTEGLAAIERNAKQQSQLIEDLLDISRVMRGKLTLKSIPLSLLPVISTALETVRLGAEAKGLQLYLQLDANVGRILGDAGRLQQVMWNLFSNAVKFTPKGGRIEVRLERVVERGGDGEMGRWGDGERGRETGEVSAISTVKAFAQIRVADTGKGISAEFLPYVFDYFRQEDSSSTRHFGGLGLGMSIARQIVEMHGGTIWVESPGEGHGATFFVQFPLLPETIVPQPKLEIPATELSDSLPLAGIRVLVVDDDTDNLQFLTLFLQENGAIVTAAASASEGLKIAQQSPPDLLLSDIGMPEMDGYSLLAAIRSLPAEIASVPAIALTAYAQEIDRHRALAVGFQEHLAKPIESDLLLAKILAAIDRSKRSAP
ncbi:MAG: PAS domain-containing protein [Cyanosarcina radialis HA8281-LM2]|jgi:PAS domain S-box-containing protein|nr:PAS domain-containing protein [Cyanosarcina radialis HA8281-LM2]